MLIVERLNHRLFSKISLRVIASAAFGLLAWTLILSEKNVGAVEAPAVAADFSLLDLNSRSEIRGHWSDAKVGTVVVFLSSRCPCSMAHEAQLAELAREFAPKGIQFIGVHANQDEDRKLAEAHFQSVRLPFPVGRDEGAELANRLKAFKTPHAFLLNRRGEVIFQGGVDDSQDPSRAQKFFLRDALVAWQSGKRPDPSQVRVLGCAIRR